MHLISLLRYKRIKNKILFDNWCSTHILIQFRSITCKWIFLLTSKANLLFMLYACVIRTNSLSRTTLICFVSIKSPSHTNSLNWLGNKKLFKLVTFDWANFMVSQNPRILNQSKVQFILTIVTYFLSQYV